MEQTVKEAALVEPLTGRSVSRNATSRERWEFHVWSLKRFSSGIM